MFKGILPFIVFLHFFVSCPIITFLVQTFGEEKNILTLRFNIDYKIWFVVYTNEIWYDKYTNFVSPAGPRKTSKQKTESSSEIEVYNFKHTPLT